jgi:methylmalonyl-CoA mutase N-terminal domain/subunit
VRGRGQSLHPNSLDEAYALPAEHAVTIALRTQQVIAYESGVPEVPDPFGGSYFLERLTLDVEQAAIDYIRKIDDMGGMIPAIERGYPQTEIANASYEYQHSVEHGESVVVGVNKFVEPEERPIELLQIDENAERRQLERLAEVKRKRSTSEVAKTLDALRRAAAGTENTMPYMHDAVRAYATVGEICAAVQDVFGSYTETSVV